MNYIRNIILLKFNIMPQCCSFYTFQNIVKYKNKIKYRILPLIRYSPAVTRFVLTPLKNIRQHLRTSIHKSTFTNQHSHTNIHTSIHILAFTNQHSHTSIQTLVFTHQYSHIAQTTSCRKLRYRNLTIYRPSLERLGHKKLQGDMALSNTARPEKAQLKANTFSQIPLGKQPHVLSPNSFERQDQAKERLFHYFHSSRTSNPRASPFTHHSQTTPLGTTHTRYPPASRGTRNIIASISTQCILIQK